MVYNRCAVELRTTRHSVYQTADHIVWIPKYRRKVLRGTLKPPQWGLLGVQ